LRKRQPIAAVIRTAVDSTAEKRGLSERVNPPTLTTDARANKRSRFVPETVGNPLNAPKELRLTQRIENPSAIDKSGTTTDRAISDKTAKPSPKLTAGVTERPSR
jgi:hypothetical protein